MNTAIRYMRAFFQALQITLRGEQPEPPPFAELKRWAARAGELSTQVYKAAAAHRLDPASMVLPIERREHSMKVILDAVIYHASQEYPYLLANVTRNHVAAVYTTNVNDVFLVTRLHDWLPDSPVKQAVAALKAHLEAIPPQS